MRRKKINLDVEKAIATGCIISGDFLSGLEKIYNEDFISTPYVKIIIKWCFDFNHKFDGAPGRHIQEIFKKETKRNDFEEDLQDLLEEFLQILSDDYEALEDFNADFLLHEALEYFEEQSMKNLSADVKIHLQNKNPDKAKELINIYSMPKLLEGNAVEIFEDYNPIMEAFEEREDALFTFPGALGYMINPYLVKGGLIGIMGPEKRGKTFWLIAILLQALKHRCKVAFFGVGDMSRNQMIRRILIAINGKSDEKRYCGEIAVPVSGEWVEDDEGNYIEVKTEIENIKEPLTWREGWKGAKRFKKIMRKGRFVMECFPTDSVNVQDLKGVCRKWKKEKGFIPDLILVDYGDILAPEPGVDEIRPQNKTWKALRNWSLDKSFNEPLLIVPTQTDADSYDQTTLRRKNFSEDKRKYAHVTGMLGLNQTDEEKTKGVMRLSWVLLREGEYIESICCTILQCLKKGQVVLKSFWKSSNENE